MEYQEKIKLCDFGCGKEAKYQFKNGKLCCSKNYQQCPEGNKLNLKTEEWKLKHSIKLKGHIAWNKGLKYHIKNKEEKYKSIRIRMKLNNPMKNPEISLKNANSRRRNGTTGLGKPKPESIRLQSSIRMKLNNPMKNPETIEKNFKNHNRQKSGPEKYLEKVFEKINLNIQYIGDGSIFINGKAPDFIIPGTKKLIEVYDSSFIYSGKIRDENWIEKRRNDLYGYDILFIDFNIYGKARNFEKLCDVIQEFYF